MPPNHPGPAKPGGGGFFRFFRFFRDPAPILHDWAAFLGAPTMGVGPTRVLTEWDMCERWDTLRPKTGCVGSLGTMRAIDQKSHSRGRRFDPDQLHRTEGLAAVEISAPAAPEMAVPFGGWWVLSGS